MHLNIWIFLLVMHISPPCHGTLPGIPLVEHSLLEAGGHAVLGQASPAEALLPRPAETRGLDKSEMPQPGSPQHSHHVCQGWGEGALLWLLLFN